MLETSLKDGELTPIVLFLMEVHLVFIFSRLIIGVSGCLLDSQPKMDLSKMALRQ